MNSFSNTLHRFKKWNFSTVRGALAPRTPCGGRVIAFKWPGRPPPPKKILATPLNWEYCYLCRAYNIRNFSTTYARYTKRSFLSGILYEKFHYFRRSLPEIYQFSIKRPNFRLRIQNDFKIIYSISFMYLMVFAFL